MQLPFSVARSISCPMGRAIVRWIRLDASFPVHFESGPNSHIWVLASWGSAPPGCSPFLPRPTFGCLHAGSHYTVRRPTRGSCSDAKCDCGIRRRRVEYPLLHSGLAMFGLLATLLWNSEVRDSPGSFSPGNPPQLANADIPRRYRYR